MCVPHLSVGVSLSCGWQERKQNEIGDVLDLHWSCDDQLLVRPNPVLIEVTGLLAHFDLIKLVNCLERFGLDAWIDQFLRLENYLRPNLVGLHNCDVLFVKVQRAEVEVVSQGNQVVISVVQELLEKVLVLFNQNVGILRRLVNLLRSFWFEHAGHKGFCLSMFKLMELLT
jgi:hypothetical protein